MANIFDPLDPEFWYCVLCDLPVDISESVCTRCGFDSQEHVDMTKDFDEEEEENGS